MQHSIGTYAAAGCVSRPTFFLFFLSRLLHNPRGDGLSYRHTAVQAAVPAPGMPTQEEPRQPYGLPASCPPDTAADQKLLGAAPRARRQAQVDTRERLAAEDGALPYQQDKRIRKVPNGDGEKAADAHGAAAECQDAPSGLHRRCVLLLLLLVLLGDGCDKGEEAEEEERKKLTGPRELQ